jgi:hypothetical protein
LGGKSFVISDQKSIISNVNQYGAVDIRKVLDKYDLKPNLLLFVEGGEMLIFPTNFSGLFFPAVWWGIDTQYAYLKHLRISTLFDHSFIAQKSYVTKLKQDGIRSVSWLPLASPKNVFKDLPRTVDLSYIGSTNWSLYPLRKKLLDIIQEKVGNCVIGERSPEEMLKIYSCSKIVFNQSLKNDINMRVFEAMGAGALLLTSPISENGMDELFIEGQDYITYNDPEDLTVKIQTYLRDDNARKKIAESGKLKVLNSHTYDIRSSEIVKIATSGLEKIAYSSLQEAMSLVSLSFYCRCNRVLSTWTSTGGHRSPFTPGFNYC